MADLPSTEKGRVGELFVRYAFARMGIKYAETPYNSDDLIVLGKDGLWKRCEIKTASKGYLIGLRRTRYREGAYVDVPYEDIDFFVLVALETEEIFIVPYHDVIGKHKICCAPTAMGWKYRLRKDIF